MPGEHVTVLQALVSKLLEGRISGREFEKSFVDYYNDEVPESAPMLDSEREFFDDIQDRLMLVGENPDEDDRKHGYIDFQQFIVWLRGRRAQLDQ